jgi:CheY-like chemotaxis protein
MTDKKKILIIDDDPVHLYTAKGLLESISIEVITHQGAFGAIQSVKTHLPDLVLLDVNMPALSGDTLASLIKPFCITNKTPILFYSSNDEQKLLELTAIHGVAGYICKGDSAALRSKVKQQLSL